MITRPTGHRAFPCAAVPVARTTFYAHYRNVDDVLLEVEDGLLEGLADVTERVSGGVHCNPIKASDIDAVLLTHLDCDHANGIVQVKDAKRFVVAADEVRFASKITNRVRYNRGWWRMVTLDEFEWNDDKGPFGKSYDLLGDGSIQLVNIPGHADGLFAVKVINEEGKFVLLFSDGGYAAKSWQEQITSGVAADKGKQKTSLAWIREQSLDPMCVESLANHDPDVEPHVIEL